MPSTMIHLMFAQKLSDNAPTEFYIGSIAPDAIAVREDYHFKVKDKMHFRVSDDPLEDIERLAKEIGIENPYCEGYIAHLFLDTQWDKDCMKPFILEHGAHDWVRKYRFEISKASSWLYHNDESLRSIWKYMVNCTNPALADIQGITYEEIVKYYSLNHSWFNQFYEEQSTVYPNAFVVDYTKAVAKKYVAWKESVFNT